MILAEVAVDDQRSRFHQRIFDIIYTEMRCSCISQSLEYLVLKEFLPDSPDPVLRWYYADSPLERQRVSGHQERIDGSSLTKNAKKKNMASESDRYTEGCWFQKKMYSNMNDSQMVNN